tara:strand:+ start:3252 stop:3449 length:198 start_codon:yes stop_codon:yes gene_type:complete
MARGKVTTSKELKEANSLLTDKLQNSVKRLNATLTRVGGLRAHIAANNPTNEDIIRILDSIIAES